MSASSRYETIPRASGAPSDNLITPQVSPAALDRQPRNFTFGSSKLLVTCALAALCTFLALSYVHSPLDVRNVRGQVTDLFNKPSLDFFSASTNENVPNLNAYYFARESNDIEITVPTGDCSSGLYCRARLVIAPTETGVTVSAGYFITTPRDPPKAVTDATSRRVAAVTRSEAEAWAKKLLANGAEDLNTFNISVDPQAVADAIMDTKDDAATCPETSDPLCSTLETVSTLVYPSPSPTSTPSPSPTPPAPRVRLLAKAKITTAVTDSRRLAIISSLKVPAVVGGYVWPDQWWEIYTLEGSDDKKVYIRNAHFNTYILAMNEHKQPYVREGELGKDALWNIEWKGVFVSFESELYPGYVLGFGRSKYGVVAREKSIRTVLNLWKFTY